LAIASLVLGVLSLPTCGLLGIGALVGIRLGIEALLKAKKAPHEFGGKGLAIAGIVTNVASLIIGIALFPRLLPRPHVEKNEEATLGDIRAVIEAEKAYRSANGGFYDTLDCLGAPTRCIPSYHGPAFIDPTLLQANHGYDRRFHAGPAPTPRPGKGFSPSSLQSFAYVAVPISGSTGTRAFCGDSSSRICYTPGGSAPPVVDGQCASSCASLP
jgi:hypothetical protein